MIVTACKPTRLLGLLLLAASLATASEPAEDRSLTILNTGGLSGRLNAWQSEQGDSVGGMRRVVTWLRAAGPNALVVDTGNAFGPALLSKHDKGRTMVRLLNHAGLAAQLPAHHDLSLHLDTLQARAAEAAFPLIVANLVRSTTQTPVFATHTVVERQGLRIGLIGLLSAELLQRVHPKDREGLDIIPPAAALSTTQQGMSEEPDVDLTIVLAHMDYPEVLALARAATGVDLFIVGGYLGDKSPGPYLHSVRLGNGTRIVSMPGTGFGGRVDVTFENHEDRWHVSVVDTQFEPFTGPESDDLAHSWIAQQSAAFLEERAAIVGTMDSPRTDAVVYLARLMRATAAAEVAILNRGALRPMELAGDVRQATLDSLLRFDDDVVIIALTGAELKRLQGASHGSQRSGQRLVFAGYDAGQGTVNGRAVKAAESYRVATTTFLARGGDGYLRGVEPEALPDRPQLRSLLHSAVQAGGRLRGVDMSRGQSVWITRWEPKGTLSLTNTYEQSLDKPFENALAWNGVLQAESTHARPGRSLVHVYKTRFGQVRGRDGLQESTDKIDSKLTLTWLRRGLEPFAALDVNSEWTARDNSERRLTTRATTGAGLKVGTGQVTLGLGVERDFATEKTQVGLEAVPTYNFGLFGFNVKTQTELFYAAHEQRFQAENQSSLEMDLPGDLKFSIDAEVGFRWDDQEGRQLVSEVQMGLGFGFGWERKMAR